MPAWWRRHETATGALRRKTHQLGRAVRRAPAAPSPFPDGMGHQSGALRGHAGPAARGRPDPDREPGRGQANHQRRRRHDPSPADPAVGRLAHDRGGFRPRGGGGRPLADDLPDRQPPRRPLHPSAGRPDHAARVVPGPGVLRGPALLRQNGARPPPRPARHCRASTRRWRRSASGSARESAAGTQTRARGQAQAPPNARPGGTGPANGGPR